MARSPLTIGGRRLVTADTHSGYDGAVGSVRGGRRFRDIIQKLTALWHMALCNGENKHGIMFSPPGRLGLMHKRIYKGLGKCGQLHFPIINSHFKRV